MHAKSPPASPMETDPRPDREKLIRLLSALMARRWWREQLRESGCERSLAIKRSRSQTESDNS